MTKVITPHASTVPVQSMIWWWSTDCRT